METGGVLLVEKELDIAVDIGVGRGETCGGGASPAEDRVAIPLVLHSISDKDLQFQSCLS